MAILLPPCFLHLSFLLCLPADWQQQRGTERRSPLPHLVRNLSASILLRSFLFALREQDTRKIVLILRESTLTTQLGRSLSKRESETKKESQACFFSSVISIHTQSGCFMKCAWKDKIDDYTYLQIIFAYKQVLTPRARKSWAHDTLGAHARDKAFVLAFPPVNLLIQSFLHWRTIC